MQGLITLDLGNTNPHAGMFIKATDGWKLEEVVSLEKLQVAAQTLNLNPGNSSIVISQVKPQEAEINRLTQEGWLLTWVKDYWRGGRFAGMPVNYAQTLGEDRLICAWHLYKKFNEPCLLIDAGSFVTMDVITSAGFQGGFIIPGLKNYLEIYQRGHQLQQIELTPHISPTLPQTSNEAMAGSYSAFGALAKKLLQDFNLRKLVLTGGQMDYWEMFFAAQDTSLVVEKKPHLVHSALHHWMTTQIEPL